MGTPLTIVKGVISDRRKWLKEAVDAKKIALSLPPEIRSQEGCTGCDIYGDKLDISFSFTGDGHEISAEACAKTLKMAGVVGFRAYMRYGQEWSYIDGNMVLPDEHEVKFSIHGCAKPPECRIEEYTETVTRYRAICKETEEPI